MHAQIIALEKILETALAEVRNLKKHQNHEQLARSTGFTREEEALWFKGKNRTLTEAGKSYLIELCNNGGDVTTLRNRMGLGSTSASKYYRWWEELVTSGQLDKQ